MRQGTNLTVNLSARKTHSSIAVATAVGTMLLSESKTDRRLLIAAGGVIPWRSPFL